MILAFDLDDTLYPEITYVHSGFQAVAAHVEEVYGVPAARSERTLLTSLERDGRGRLFDALLEQEGLYRKARVRELLAVYRSHRPSLALAPGAGSVLQATEHLPRYLVTDGNQRVQARKIDSLDLWGRFRWCYLTNRYGRSAAKPANRVFELLLRREGADAGELVYVGDNPAKDFVGVNRLGGRTIRVLTGAHAGVVAPPGYDAHLTIGGLDELPDALDEVGGSRS